LTGVLSQRVLGQYDLALLDSASPPRLLLLAPNLALTARNLGIDRDELVAWVSIHEITHAVQFSTAPWLRGHLGGMISELIDGLQVNLTGGAQRRNSQRGAGRSWAEILTDTSALRELVERAGRGELLRLTLGEDRWQLVERMQAVMSLIEGHAEHTMDAVGADVLPSLPRLRAAMTRRRQSRGLPWRVLERLLGLELKLRQYELGRRFCDAVVEQDGPLALARAWRGPESLPTPAELDAPAQWLARTATAPAPA
ncbi:MAG TPA: zinc-dependent metalloprotease, partial [Solirubrobacteraceae bacterium]|nr:zinc-dependent metalloprotease [Solirubrobacteraceae bacterium]